MTWPLAFFRSGSRKSVNFEPSGDLLTLGRTGLARWPVHTSHSDRDALQVGPPDLRHEPHGRENRSEAATDGFWASVMIMKAQSSWTSINRSRRCVSALRPTFVTSRFTPTESWAATGSHNSRDGIKVWSLPDGRLEKHFPNPGLYASPRFSPDGRWLATQLGNKLTLWTVGGWRAGLRLEGELSHFHRMDGFWRTRRFLDRCDWSRPRPDDWSRAWTIPNNPARCRQRSVRMVPG